jgi:CHAT domain-containing protein
MVWSQAQNPRQSSPPTDAPAPFAHTELQPQVQTIHQLLQEKNYAAVLEQSATLLQQARQQGDKVGQAYALRAQAIALQHQNRLEESTKLWEQAAALWKEIGDVPYEVEALLEQLWDMRSETSQRRQATLERALAATQQKTNRPLALAEVLQRYGQRFYDAKQQSIALPLLERAVEMRRAVAPDSREMGVALYFVGEIYHGWGDRELARKTYQQALQILENVAPDSVEIVAILTSLAAIEQAFRRYPQALEYAERAARLAEQQNASPPIRAAALFQLGEMCRWANQLERAENSLLQGVEICLRHAEIDRRLLVSGYMVLTTVMVRQSQIEKALEYAQRAWEVQEQIDPESVDAAQILAMRSILWMQKYRFKDAIECADRALAIAQRVYPALDSPELIQTLVAVGTARLAQGKHNDSLDMLDRARQLAFKVGDFDALPVILSMLKSLSSALGRSEQAQRYQQELDALGRPDILEPVVRIFNLTTQVQAALIEGDLLTAIRLANEGLDLCRRTELPLMTKSEIALIVCIGVAHARLGDHLAAERAFREAYQRCLQTDNDPASLAGIEANLGATLIALERMDEARMYLERAHERWGGARHLDSITCSINLANVYARRGEYDKAANELKQVVDWLRAEGVNTLVLVRALGTLSDIEIRRKHFDAAHRYLDEAMQLYDSLRLRSTELIILNMNRARAYRAQGDRARANRSLQEAMRLLEQQRMAWGEPELRALFAEQYWDVYTLWAQQRIRERDYAGAVEALERSRARMLGELMQRRQATLTAPDESTRQILQEWEDLRRNQLRVARRMLNVAVNSPEWSELQQQRESLERKHRSLLQRLQRQSPRHYELFEPKPLGIAQIQSALPPGTVALYYGIAEEEVLIVAITRNRVQGYVQPVPARELRRLVRQFCGIVAKPPGKRSSLERDQLISLGRRLYVLLVRPAAEILKNATRVIICPTDQLNLLPWGALVVSGSSTTNAVYWGEQMAMHLTPSMGVYLQARRVRPAGEQVVAVALTYKGSSNPAVQLVAQQSAYASRFEVDTLDYALSEAATLESHFGRRVRTLAEQAATPATVRAVAQSARVLHFACHAFVDNNDPYGSLLSLSPPLEAAGFVRAADVMSDWRLQADLVMLAACNTNVGALQRYEGVFGLARAFLVAGARTVGATLWQISDEATHAFAKAFYAHYAKGMAKDESLRQAQRTLRKDRQFSDPYFWSGFVIIGDYQNGVGAPAPQSRTNSPRPQKR